MHHRYRSARVFDTQSGASLLAIDNGRKARFSSLWWDSMHKQLVLGDTTGHVAIWDVASERQLVDEKLCDGEVREVSTAGSELLASSDGIPAFTWSTASRGSLPNSSRMPGSVMPRRRCGGSAAIAAWECGSTGFDLTLYATRCKGPKKNFQKFFLCASVRPLSSNKLYSDRRDGARVLFLFQPSRGLPRLRRRRAGARLVDLVEHAPLHRRDDRLRSDWQKHWHCGLRRLPLDLGLHET